MRVLVVGATGYLGRAIVRAVAAHGHEPVAFARHATSSGLRVACVDGDVRDRHAVFRAVAGVDVVCHSAALVSIWRRHSREYDDVNVGGLANVLEAARHAGTRKLVYTSTFLALPPCGRPEPLLANDYQRTKIAAHAIVADMVARGAPIVTLYPGVIYGPGARTEGNLVGSLLADHIRGRLPGIVGPEYRWSFSYVDDVADAHLAAVERAEPGSRYIVGGENATQRRLFELVREITGRPVPPRIPFPVAMGIAAAEELRAHVTGALPRLTRGVVEIFHHDWALDSTPAMAALGYTVTPLASGVRHTIAALTSAPGPTR